MTADQGNGIGKGGQSFGIPGGSTSGESVVGDQGKRQHRHEGKQAHQDRCGASDAFRRPLALSFDAQVGTDVLKGRFHLPTPLKEGQDRFWCEEHIGRQERLWLKLACHNANKDNANRDSFQAAAIPDRGSTDKLNVALGLPIPGQGQTRPDGVGCPRLAEVWAGVRLFYAGDQMSG